MSSLNGKVIVITGGAGGIGETTARMAVFLFSGLASGCNGNTYLVDGGYCAQ